MLKINSQEDSTVAAAVNLPPTDSKADFESEAMPHLNDLYQAAFHMLQPSAKASDAVQETYLRAWERCGESRRGMNCKLWLFQILFNVVLSGNQASSGMELQEAGLLSNAPDQIVSAMNRIPLDLRAALILIDGQGFSYKDAAEILGLSGDVVAHHIVLGRNQLYSQLEACRPTLAAAAN